MKPNFVSVKVMRLLCGIFTASEVLRSLTVSVKSQRVIECSTAELANDMHASLFKYLVG